MNSAKLHLDHLIRMRDTQRRGQWALLTRKIDELRFRSKFKDLRPGELADLDACKRELDDLETIMKRDGQEP